MMNYTNHNLTKIETLLLEANYELRYEKGSFNAGNCLLEQQKIILVNRYFTTEARILCLIDLIKTLEIDASALSQASLKIFKEIDKPKA